MSERPLVIVANRLPVSKREDGTWQASAGGLVTALRPVVAERGGHWVGWDGGEGDVPSRVEGLDVDLQSVRLSNAEVQGYYHGFSNRTLWPLMHDLVRKPVIDRRAWRVYEQVNRKFAEAVAAIEFDADRPPMLWVQDYHLFLTPDLLRGLLPSSPLGFFLHIPFPPPELMAQLPWREPILRGMLGADVVAFHTDRFRRNFLRSVERVFPEIVRKGKKLLLPDGRKVRTAAHPISIDASEFATIARSAGTDAIVAELEEQFAGKTVLLGVDRLDYTKGIRHRLQAIELLLERRPDLRERVAFVQIAVPSRDDVKEYKELREDVELTIGRINGRFTEPGGDVPVHYLYRGVEKERLLGYYRLADVMLVTPLKDGMNLVAKEYVIAQHATGGHGRLVLSEFAGTALEMPRALHCNPFDVEGLSYVLEYAIEADAEKAADAIEALAARVREFDVHRWVNEELSDIEAAAGRRS